MPLFDPVFYLEANPDVAQSESDPFENSLAFGLAEFDMRFYVNCCGCVLGGMNPLLHYLANRTAGMYAPIRPEREALIPGAVRRATRALEYFEVFAPVPVGTGKRAILLAYYLPQFHRSPENDAYWGEGFTDWTNLARRLPCFAGHMQPRIPRDLGFYNLDNPEILRK